MENQENSRPKPRKLSRVQTLDDIKFYKPCTDRRNPDFRSANIEIKGQKRLNVYSCRACDAIFKTRGKLDKHSCPTDGFICEKCGKIFTKQFILNKHLQSHNLSFPCKICDKIFTQKNSLERHLASHLNLKKVQCEHCPVQFASKYNLIKHIEKIHPQDNEALKCRIKCAFCESYFRNERVLSYHQVTYHNEGRIKSRKENNNQSEEMDMTVGNVLNNLQELSEQTSYKNDILMQAIEESNINLAPEVDVRKVKIRVVNGVRKFFCDICNVDMRKLSQLKRHVTNVHSTAKPFKCPLCDNRFKYSLNLRKHMRNSHNMKCKYNNNESLIKFCKTLLKGKVDKKLASKQTIEGKFKIPSVPKINKVKTKRVSRTKTKNFEHNASFEFNNYPKSDTITQDESNNDDSKTILITNEEKTETSEYIPEIGKSMPLLESFDLKEALAEPMIVMEQGKESNLNKDEVVDIQVLNLPSDLDQNIETNDLTLSVLTDERAIEEDYSNIMIDLDQCETITKIKAGNILQNPNSLSPPANFELATADPKIFHKVIDVDDMIVYNKKKILKEENSKENSNSSDTGDITENGRLVSPFTPDMFKQVFFSSTENSTLIDDIKHADIQIIDEMTEIANDFDVSLFDTNFVSENDVKPENKQFFECNIEISKPLEKDLLVENLLGGNDSMSKYSPSSHNLPIDADKRRDFSDLPLDFSNPNISLTEIEVQQLDSTIKKENEIKKELDFDKTLTRKKDEFPEIPSNQNDTISLNEIDIQDLSFNEEELCNKKQTTIFQEEILLPLACSSARVENSPMHEIDDIELMAIKPNKGLHMKKFTNIPDSYLNGGTEVAFEKVNRNTISNKTISNKNVDTGIVCDDVNSSQKIYENKILKELNIEGIRVLIQYEAKINGRDCSKKVDHIKTNNKISNTHEDTVLFVTNLKENCVNKDRVLESHYLSTINEVVPNQFPNKTNALVLAEKCNDQLEIQMQLHKDNTPKSLPFLTKHDIRKQRKQFNLDFGLITCDICKKRFSEKGLLSNHIKNVHMKVKTKKKKTYKCEICLHIFVNFSTLKDHIKRHEGFENMFQCVICRESYTSTFNLRRHILGKHLKTDFSSVKVNFASIDLNEEILKKYSYECNDCLQRFPNTDDLKAHKNGLKCNQLEVNKNKCGICSKLLSTSWSLRQHMFCHDAKKYYCDKCDKVFSRKSTLKIHLKTHDEHKKLVVKPQEVNNSNEYFGILEREFLANPPRDINKELQRALSVKSLNNLKDVKRYKCEVCPATLGTPFSLRLHMTSHEGIKYYCDKCNKAFKLKVSLQKHLDCHEKPEDRVKCQVCGEMRARSSIRLHMRIHNNETPYECPLCNEKFKFYSQRKNHISTHINGTRPNKKQTENTLMKMLNDLDEVVEPEPELENLGITLNEVFEDHNAVKKEKKCPECGKEFADRTKMLRHITQVHKARKNVCDCGAMYAQKYRLIKHKKRFNNQPHENPYTCRRCWKVFASRSELTSHMPSHFIV